MEVFDVIVVGSGAGMMIVDAAVNRGLKVALVEMGKLGGTCLNRGCIPTKMVIYPADMINQIIHAEKLGIKARIEEIDFAAIMERTRNFVAHDREPMENAVENIDGLSFYPVKGEFIEDYTMKVGDQIIKGDNIFLASGARPWMPPIKGLEDIDYLTDENVWDLTEAPESMIMVGGGLIAVEMAHFFSSMGVHVTVLSRSPRLVKENEPELSEILITDMRKRMHIETNIEVISADKDGNVIEITGKTKAGETKRFKAESVFMATGRRSNADLLRVDKTGIQVDERGYIIVNAQYLTNKPRIWAFGDAIGKLMYRHVANKEAELVWNIFNDGHSHLLDYDKVPYAIFTWPQIATVGITEREAINRGKDILIGEYRYKDTAKGAAMEDENGYVKVILENETYKILGAHIIGRFAPILIQEIINTMHAGDGTAHPITDAMHIHPALPEVIQRAFFNLRLPGDHHH